MPGKFLAEAYQRVKKITGNMPLGNEFREILRRRDKWNVYVESLGFQLHPKQSNDFRQLAENTRLPIMENASFNLNPYESLTIPILRMFYPKLVAKELVTVSPIDKPEVVKGFIRAKFGSYDDDISGLYPYQFPYLPPLTSSGVSRGPSAGISTDKIISANSVNLIEEVDDSLLGSTFIDKDFAIVGVNVDDGTGTKDVEFDVPLMADVDGNFSKDIKVGNTVVDTLLGRIKFNTGLLEWSSVNGKINAIAVRYFLSLEKNKINPRVRYEVEKIRLAVVERKISAEWTIPFEQDIKALYDLNLMEELVNIMAEQIAIDIDAEIIKGLISAVNIYNPTAHIDKFYLTPPTNYTWGPDHWYKNIMPKINKLAAVVYNDSKMGSANVIACNPVDAAVLQSLNTFLMDGGSDKDGSIGYQSATLQGGSYKVLVSQNIPERVMLILYKSDEVQRSVYFYAPYVPVMLTPYPLGPNPNISLMTRYALKTVRPEAISVLQIDEGQES